MQDDKVKMMAPPLITNPYAYSPGSFPAKLKALINTHNIECGSNTSDTVLAKFLLSCLNAFDTAVREREGEEFGSQGIDTETKNESE